jgi:hypothetical protein
MRSSAAPGNSSSNWVTSFSRHYLPVFLASKSSALTCVTI